MQTFGREQVAGYYDTNTSAFLRVFGSGFGVAAIHRQVWGPGVETALQAFEFTNQLVKDWSPTRPAKLLDLGCGVGGTMTWLAERTAHELVGVTLSPVQVRLGRQRAERLGLASRCDLMLADATRLPMDGPFDVAFAIESLIHIRETSDFFAEAARVLRPGGRLIVCDDFVSGSASEQPRAQHVLRRFREGWRAAGLGSARDVRATAAAAGFSLLEERDLTPFLRTAPGWLTAAGGLALRLPLLRGDYWDSLRGSTALQVCIAKGWTEYRALCWEKRS